MDGTSGKQAGEHFTAPRYITPSLHPGRFRKSRNPETTLRKARERPPRSARAISAGPLTHQDGLPQSQNFPPQIARHSLNSVRDSSEASPANLDITGVKILHRQSAVHAMPCTRSSMQREFVTPGSSATRPSWKMYRTGTRIEVYHAAPHVDFEADSSSRTSPVPPEDICSGKGESPFPVASNRELHRLL